MRQVFDHALKAIKGTRKAQEDTAVVHAGADADARTRSDDRDRAGPDALIAVLADGMGGHVGGALASRTVCDTFIAACETPAQDGQRGEDRVDVAALTGSARGDVAAREPGPGRARLLQALHAANAALAIRIEDDPLLSGMGSTLVGAMLDPAGLQWVSVGDSLLMLWRQGELAALNEDHSLAPELDRLVALGRLTPEAARTDPRRHMLRSAVTGDELDLVDLSRAPLALEPGDYVILASDGLQTLEQAEIARIITAYAEDGADAVASALIRAVEAVRDFHQDNTTIIAIRARSG